MSAKTRKPRRVAVGAPEAATTWPARSDSKDSAGSETALWLAAVAMLDVASGLLERIATLSDTPDASMVAAADSLDAARDLIANGTDRGELEKYGLQGQNRAASSFVAKPQRSLTRTTRAGN